jgi:hypothetical protein
MIFALELPAATHNLKHMASKNDINSNDAKS